ncbi:hypothetical protein [Gloeobacter violaceus]|uniref:Gll3283 protein n=1 Tax=Gloeobacter violaceus (strain ATCC 29082 / PCC 7421) TaxID=251221 RepID=Q7NG90_GLOVI|nr:hypothetical protein [Gloeobacter violaceus]BAC91224.1 gll3283 [Gloeobacter violaceus PCC 7421]
MRKKSLTLLPCLLFFLALPTSAQEQPDDPTRRTFGKTKSLDQPSQQIVFSIQIIELDGTGLQTLSKAIYGTQPTTGTPASAENANRLRRAIFEQVRAGRGRLVVDTELTVGSGERAGFDSQLDMNFTLAPQDRSKPPTFSTVRAGNRLEFEPAVLPDGNILTKIRVDASVAAARDRNTGRPIDITRSSIYSTLTFQPNQTVAFGNLTSLGTSVPIPANRTEQIILITPRLVSAT